jgi:hypothetical protein
MLHTGLQTRPASSVDRHTKYNLKKVEVLDIKDVPPKSGGGHENSACCGRDC